MDLIGRSGIELFLSLILLSEFIASERLFLIDSTVAEGAPIALERLFSLTLRWLRGALIASERLFPVNLDGVGATIARYLGEAVSH